MAASQSRATPTSSGLADAHVRPIVARGFVTQRGPAAPDASKVAVLYFDDESGGHRHHRPARPPEDRGERDEDQSADGPRSLTRSVHPAIIARARHWPAARRNARAHVGQKEVCS